MSNKSQKSKKSTESLKESSKESGVDGEQQRIREFIYLDFPKLTSYFAQILEGLPKGKSLIEGGGLRKLARDPETEVSYSGEGEAKVGDPDLNPINVTKLLGIMARVEAQISKLVRSGGNETERTQAKYLIESKELHHDVFQSIETFFREQNLIEENLDRKASKRPFYMIKGQVDFIDFDHLIDTIHNFNQLASNFQKITGQDIGSVDNAEALEYLLNRFFSDRLAVFMRNGNTTVSTLLDSNYLTSPIQMITDNYGRQSHVEVTIFGLKVDQANRGTTSSKSAGTYANDMTKQMLVVNNALETMDAALRIRGDIHLFPIAIFVDL